MNECQLNSIVERLNKFYDVLESFYDSDLIMKMKSSIDKYL